MYDDLTYIYLKLLELIVKLSAISDAKAAYDLIQIDLSDSKTLLKISMSKSDSLHQEKYNASKNVLGSL